MRLVMSHPGCVDVAADEHEAADVDTWDDAARLGVTRDTPPPDLKERPASERLRP
jgi:hypothetical protein